MNFINGVFKVLYIKKGDDYYPIGCLTSNSFDESSEMLDTTTRDNAGWDTSLPTNQSYSIAFDGLVTKDFDDGVTISYYELRQLKRGRTLIEWKIEDTSNNSDYGMGYIDSIGDSASIDELVSFTGNITGYGIPTYQKEQDNLNYNLNTYI